MVAGDTLLLIDGHGLVFRAYFAMPALSNSRGEATNAVYGFTSMLLKVLAEQTPTHAVACFDPAGPTFRHEAFTAYKAQRPPVPDEVVRQLPLCREVCQALGIALYEVPGYEADDVIGTLARRAAASGLDVVVLTGDLDMLQLVDEHVRVYAPRRGITDTVVYDRDRVLERYGFGPELIPDFKALRGDPSDNIPGVPGVGEKTARALIAEYGPVERILEAAPQLPEGRLRQALLEHAEQVRLSKRMVTLVTDLPIDLELEATRLRGYDVGQVRELFERLEFRSLLNRLPRYGTAAEETLPPSPASVANEVVVEVVGDVAGAERLAERLRSAAGVAVRSVVVEPARRGRVVGLALAAIDDPTRAWYVPLGGADRGHAHGAAWEPLWTLLADANVALTTYDLKRELLCGQVARDPVPGRDCDELLAAYLVNTRARVPSVPVLLHELCGLSLPGEDELLGSGRTARSVADLDVHEAATYYGRWVAMVGRLRLPLLQRLEELGMRRLYDEMELPLVPILVEMERCGIAVDLAGLATLSRELYERIVALEAEIYQVAGRSFNIASTQQLASVLYDDLGLAAGRRTKTGRSTDADTLEALRGAHPIVDLVLEWRQLSKLKSTYVDVLPLLVEADGRVHTSFHQTVAATGRLSSSDPNLQNVPIRSEWGQRVRACFVAGEESSVLVSVDYSQIELRVLAHLSGEPELVEAFARGEDIHRRTAADVYGVDPQSVTLEQRRIAKVVNFGVVYGLSEFGLARDTGMSQEEARAYITRYFESFPGVAAYLERIRTFARERGYVETLFGRRRYLPDIHAANRALRQAAERMAVNMPIQGTAADIMKLAMIRCRRGLRQAGLRSRMLLQVHDELVLEAPGDELDAVVAVVCEAMSGAADLVVPLAVDVKVGKNWRDMEPVVVTAAAGG